MPIITLSDIEISDRDYEIGLLGGIIDDAARSKQDITGYALAALLLDELDDARASAEDEANWLASLPDEPDDERLSEAEEARLDAARRNFAARRKALAIKPPKPRYRVRAATQHSI